MTDKCPECGASIYFMPGDGTQHCANHHVTKAPPIRIEDHMEKYRVRILIDRLDKPGTDTAEVHVGNVHATSIQPLVALANKLTAEFGKLDEVKK